MAIIKNKKLKLVLVPLFLIGGLAALVGTIVYVIGSVETTFNGEPIVLEDQIKNVRTDGQFFDLSNASLITISVAGILIVTIPVLILFYKARMAKE